MRLPSVSAPRFAALAAAVAALPAFAGSGDALSEDAFLSDLPMVLSATRLRQPLSETPAAMTIIDRDMIRDSGAWDVADLFRLVPGMFVAYNVDKEVVPGQVVSYHGLTDPYAKRMQIQVDGRSVYTPLFGGPIWSNIPLSLEDIERVEVVRGPSAATYGANSFLGVINIITRDPAETQGRLVSLSAGKPGSDATLRYGGKTEQADYRLTVQLRDDKGYTENPGRRFEGGNTFARNDDKRIGNLSFRGDMRLTERDELQLQFGYSGGTRATGDANVQANPLRDKTVASQYGMLRWQRDLAADGQFSLRVYHNRDRLSEDSSQLFGTTPFLFGTTLGVPAPFNRAMSHVSERYDAEAQHVFSPLDSVRVVWGGGLRHDGVSSPLYMGNNGFATFRQQSLFGNVEWRPWQKLTVNLGAMLEHNSFVGSRTSPRAALNYHLTPAQTLRAGVSRAYRNPVLYEQQGNSRWLFPVLPPGAPPFIPAGAVLPLQYIYGQNNLRPERIDSREVGYLLELGPGSSIDLKYSYDTLSDLIEGQSIDCPPGAGNPLCALTTPTTSIRTFVNGGRVSVHALEAQWQQKIGDHTQIHFGWAANHVVSDATVQGNGYDNATPRHSQNLLLAHQLSPEWRASVAVYHVNSIRALSVRESMPDYTRWDARAARQFRWDGQKGELALIVQNAGGSSYREFYADNLFARRAYLNLRLEY